MFLFCPKSNMQWMACFGSSLLTGITMASVNIPILILILTLTPSPSLSPSNFHHNSLPGMGYKYFLSKCQKRSFQVIGYNSLLVSQLQEEKDPDLVFTFELASWISLASISSTFIHFRPLSSTVIHVLPLASMLIHFHPLHLLTNNINPVTSFPSFIVGNCKCGRFSSWLNLVRLAWASESIDGPHINFDHLFLLTWLSSYTSF